MFDPAHTTPLERKAIAWLSARYEADTVDAIRKDEFQRAMGCDIGQLVERLMQIDAIYPLMDSSFRPQPVVVDFWRAICAAEKELRRWWLDKIVFGAIVPFVVAVVTAFATAYCTVKLFPPPKP